jgi:hypothetical protein
MISAKQSTQRIRGMRPQSLANIAAGVLLVFTLIVPVASANSDEIVQTVGRVSYVSGGVGTDSVDRLSSLARDFNLKFVFALKSGEYVSGVKVTIADAAGKQLLDTTSEGPWFLAKLPAGSYQISATFEGNAVSRKITVEAAKLRTIDLRWAAE